MTVPRNPLFSSVVSGGRDFDVVRALDQAQAHQLARQDQPMDPLSAEDAAWQAANAMTTWTDELGRPTVPSVQAACALTRFALAVVPVDPDDLLPRPGVGPLRTAVEVVEHWRAFPRDGAALLAGAQPTEAVLVAVECTDAAAFDAWRREKATDVWTVDTDDGRSEERRSVRDLGSYGACRWSPPRAPRSRTLVAKGRDEIARMSQELVSRRVELTAAMPLTLTWMVAPRWLDGPYAEPGDLTATRGRRQQLVLPSKPRQLAPGVRVLPAGAAVPWSVARADGWRLESSVPVAPQDPPPAWLLAAFGCRWRELPSLAAA
ncbi:MAG: hypothetical protein M3P83_10650 [Actinomycetota bacterium]|nr:hypothetical protein [Actinomycetota bacterium]